MDNDVVIDMIDLSYERLSSFFYRFLPPALLQTTCHTTLSNLWYNTRCL